MDGIVDRLIVLIVALSFAWLSARFFSIATKLVAKTFFSKDFPKEAEKEAAKIINWGMWLALFSAASSFAAGAAIILMH